MVACNDCLCTLWHFSHLFFPHWHTQSSNKKNQLYFFTVSLFDHKYLKYVVVVVKLELHISSLSHVNLIISITNQNIPKHCLKNHSFFIFLYCVTLLSLKYVNSQFLLKLENSNTCHKKLGFQIYIIKIEDFSSTFISMHHNDKQHEHERKYGK